MTAAEFDAGGWSGIFDPDSLRAFSLLPEEDADEAYCVRHDREMEQHDPVLHHKGGLYTTAETFSVYYCRRCLRELPVEPAAVLRRHLAQAFEEWDRGEAPRDWFRYLAEVDST